MIQVTYIWHDCFVIELQKVIMVFDYWKDPTSNPKDYPDFIKNMDKNKSLYVFVSHHHKDHFSKKIFGWESLFKKTRYILSRDVAKHVRHILTSDSLYAGHKPKPEQIVILGEGETYIDQRIKIEAFGSTDIGNSYLAEVDPHSTQPVSFFHAGDLNAWLWIGESTHNEIEEAMRAFTRILNSISYKYPAIDFAMFPVDSRIGERYYTGAKTFVRAIKVKHFFPMHFGIGENADIIEQRIRDAANVKLYAADHGEYICLQAPYSSYLCNV